MTKEERIKKYNPYKTDLHKDGNRLYSVLMKLGEIDFHNAIVGHAAAQEYIRYVEDCIRGKEMPIIYYNWIVEQKENIKK